MKRAIVLIACMAAFVIASSAAEAVQGFKGVLMGKRLSLLRTQMECSISELKSEDSWYNVRGLQDELIGSFRRLDALVSNGKKGYLTKNQSISDRAFVEYKIELKTCISMAIAEIGLWNEDMSREQTVVQMGKLIQLIDSIDGIGILYNRESRPSRAINPRPRE